MLRAVVHGTPQGLSAHAAKGIPARFGAHVEAETCPPSQLERRVRPAIPCAAVPSARPGTGESPSACNPQSRRGGRAEEGPSPRVSGFPLYPTPAAPGCAAAACAFSFSGALASSLTVNKTKLTEKKQTYRKAGGLKTQLVPEEKSASLSQGPRFPLCSSSPGALCQPRPHHPPCTILCKTPTKAPAPHST